MKASSNNNFPDDIPLEKKSGASGIFTGIVLFLTVGYLLFYVLRAMDLIKIDMEKVETFNTIFISILMQAFPFMLIGVLVSSIMHVFIPDEWIVKIFPTKHGLGFLTAMFAGLFFPVCECAIVPVMARLVKKGVAMPIAITFMLSAPIINPIVIVSTLYAFPGRPDIMFKRVGFGLLIALLVGIGMSLFMKNSSEFIDSGSEHCDCDKKSKNKNKPAGKKVKQAEPHQCSCCSHEHNKDEHIRKGFIHRLKDLFLHAGDEFFNVGKYLIIGACITSLIQILIPKEAFTDLNAQSWLSLLIMMTMAFLFSACSTSDAFIARSFMNRFTLGAIMGFMVFGPMMDIKNLLMLLSSFKKGFVIKLTLMIFILNFIVLNLLTILII
ncbi:hypothetical protein SDC9_101967 [bioreactor metagenome]|uniref:Permease n=1 Tax=bioreactor metagenome TaxID=1076179 RepID=A0A645B085_9ZZZZ|nr:permease [Oscillospiraceae bacterium]